MNGKRRGKAEKPAPKVTPEQLAKSLLRRTRPYEPRTVNWP